MLERATSRTRQAMKITTTPVSRVLRDMFGKKNNAYLFDVFHFAGRTNVFPFGTPPPPYFMRNFMQAVAGHMVHGGITTTTISTRNQPVTTAGTQQGISSSMDSGSTNAGQSTQARYNIDDIDNFCVTLWNHLMACMTFFPCFELLSKILTSNIK